MSLEFVTAVSGLLAFGLLGVWISGFRIFRFSSGTTSELLDCSDDGLPGPPPRRLSR